MSTRTLTQLDTDFIAFSQATLDSLAAHSVRIDAAQSDADLAQTTANSAITQILQTGVDATTYTDAEIQRLRNETQALIDAVAASVGATVQSEVTNQLIAADPSYNATLAAKIAEVNALAASLNLDLSDFSNVSGQLLNTDLPALQAAIDSANSAQTATQNQLQAALANLGHTTVVEGLDAVVQQTIAMQTPLSQTVLKEPVGLWTTTSDSAARTMKVAPLPADFLTADPDFVNAYAFPAGDQTIGPAQAAQFDDDRVYRIAVRLKVTNDGTQGGVDITVGATTWGTGALPVETAETTPQRYTVADGAVLFFVYMTGSAATITRLAGKLVCDLTGSLTATTMFPFVRQNAGGVTDGRAVIGVLEIIDVTEAFSTTSEILDAFDTTPPNVPTGLAATSTVIDGVRGRMTVTWTNPATDDDAAYDLGITEQGGAEVVFPASGYRFEIDVTPGLTYDLRLRARDRFNNPSAYTAVVQHTAAGDTVAPGQVTGLSLSAGFNSIWLNWNDVTDLDLARYEIFMADAATPAPTAGSVATYTTTADNFLVSGLADNATKHFWVRAVDTSGNKGLWSVTANATTAAAPSSEVADGSITEVKIANGAVTAAKLTAGEVITLAAQIKNAIITDAKIADLSAAKLTAGTALTSSLTVNGTALGTIQTYANDPAARVNAATTQIDPGKILISGSTSLADWRTGGDLTKINGGAISANTISANKLSIGMRGISISGLLFESNAEDTTNRLSWTAGTISYVNDAGTTATASIAAGTVNWTSGTVYVTWVKGATTLTTTTLIATAYTADRVILATYGGGTNLTVNVGQTLIEGDKIKTGSIGAEQIATDFLEALTITADQIVAGTLDVGVLTVASRLSLTEGGAFAAGKTSSTDAADGFFFGNPVGAEDFVFTVSKGKGTTAEQSFTASPNKVELVNPTVKVGSATITLTARSSSTTIAETIPLAAGTEKVSLLVLGGGGGGGGGSTASNSGVRAGAGGQTVVRIKGNDSGGSPLSFEFTAAGGLGGRRGRENINGWGNYQTNGFPGQSSAKGGGGAGGLKSLGNGSSASGRGAGGGGGAGRDPSWISNSAGAGEGGYAGQLVTVEDFDLAANGIVSNASVEIVEVGAGGSGDDGPQSDGGSGSGGMVEISEIVESLSVVDLGPNDITGDTQSYVSSGSWKASFAGKLELIAIGGGGGGAGINNYGAGCGGGAAGTSVSFLDVAEGDTFSFTVGAGGLGASGSGNGTAPSGGTTTVTGPNGVSITCTGGGGGQRCNSNAQSITGGAGGVGSGGDLNFTGGKGGDITRTSGNSTVQATAGGSAKFSDGWLADAGDVVGSTTATGPRPGRYVFSDQAGETRGGAGGTRIVSSSSSQSVSGGNGGYGAGGGGCAIRNTGEGSAFASPGDGGSGIVIFRLFRKIG